MTKVNNCCSNFSETLFRVPQGLTSGLLPFNIYIYDALYDNTHCNQINYAGDNTLYCSDASLDKEIKNLTRTLATFLNSSMRII